MITHIHSYGDLLNALLQLNPEQLQEQVKIDQDDQPIKIIGSLDVLQEDLVQTDEGLEPKSNYDQSPFIQEEHYPIVYKAGAVFLNVKP